MPGHRWRSRRSPQLRRSELGVARDGAGGGTGAAIGEAADDKTAGEKTADGGPDTRMIQEKSTQSAGFDRFRSCAATLACVTDARCGRDPTTGPRWKRRPTAPTDSADRPTRQPSPVEAMMTASTLQEESKKPGRIGPIRALLPEFS